MARKFPKYRFEHDARSTLQDVDDFLDVIERTYHDKEVKVIAITYVPDIYVIFWSRLTDEYVEAVKQSDKQKRDKFWDDLRFQEDLIRGMYRD